MICAAPSSTMPRRLARVVCALRDTPATFDPTSALINVDLPALGAPSSATKPQDVLSPVAGSLIRFPIAP
jgi:hypothetical protein